MTKPITTRGGTQSRADGTDRVRVETLCNPVGTVFSNAFFQRIFSPQRPQRPPPHLSISKPPSFLSQRGSGPPPDVIHIHLHGNGSGCGVDHESVVRHHSWPAHIQRPLSAKTMRSMVTITDNSKRGSINTRSSIRHGQHSSSQEWDQEQRLQQNILQYNKAPLSSKQPSQLRFHGGGETPRASHRHIYHFLFGCNGPSRTEKLAAHKSFVLVKARRR